LLFIKVQSSSSLTIGSVAIRNKNRWRCAAISIAQILLPLNLDSGIPPKVSVLTRDRPRSADQVIVHAEGIQVCGSQGPVVRTNGVPGLLSDHRIDRIARHIKYTY
jgi:hypothetical protein